MHICPRCGKNSRGGEVCRACRATLQHREQTERMVKICQQCDRALLQNKWKEFKNIRELERKLGKGKKQKVVIKVHYLICPQCAKSKGAYYEGILQLRNPRQEILDHIHALLKQWEEKGVRITKVEQKKNGLDLYLTSQRYLQTLGKKLQQQFGGTLKINSKLHTKNRQTSKQVYRINALYDPLSFLPGDVIALKGKVLHVTRVGKLVIGKDILTRKYSTVEPKGEISVLQKQKTTVTTIHPRIEVLDPETYQSIPVENKEGVKLGEKVKIVVHEGKAYLV